MPRPGDRSPTRSSGIGSRNRTPLNRICQFSKWRPLQPAGHKGLKLWRGLPAQPTGRRLIGKFGKYRTAGAGQSRLGETAQPSQGLRHLGVAPGYYRQTDIFLTAREKVAYCRLRGVSCQFRIGKSLRGRDMARRAQHQIPGGGQPNRLPPQSKVRCSFHAWGRKMR